MSAYPITRATPADAHHFFGYYDKSPWDASARLLLTHRSRTFSGGFGPGWPIQVGYVECEGDPAFRSLRTTEAWNWQMGAQTRWMSLNGEPCVLMNVMGGSRRDDPGRASTLLVDLEGAVLRQLPAATYTATPGGNVILSVDFVRLAATHPTIGYPTAHHAAPALQDAPRGEGITAHHVENDEQWLVADLAELAAADRTRSMAGAIHWVSHLEVNPRGDRIVFLHRWSDQPSDELRWGHRLCTVGIDGTGLRVLEHSDPLPEGTSAEAGLFDHERSAHQISHPTWRDDGHVMVWSPHAGRIGYHLYEDGTDQVERFCAGKLTENGHMSYSPDGRWMVTDTYPDASGSRSLLLVETATEEIHRVAELADSAELGKHDRCDLHPRFDPSGTQLCVDSVHEGTRQMYVVDVSAKVDTPNTSGSPPAGHEPED